MTNQISTSSIMNNIAILFEKYKIEKIAETTFTKYMIKNFPVPKKIPRDVKKEIFQNKLKLICWAMSGVQIELGHMLIYSESYNSYRKSADAENTVLSYMLFMHHHL